MKGRIAFVLALFTLLLSTESTFMFHYCHSQFVSASVNKELSTCCIKKAHKEPVVRGICCELASFDTQLNDTILDESLDSLELPLYDFVLFVTPFVQSALASLQVQLVTPRPPPKPFSVSLHILYEHYLI